MQVNLASTIRAAFVANFRDFQTRVHTLSSPLTDVRFWRRPYPYGNSVGHLMLHLTGNLRFYVGRLIAGTDYVRDRNREFFDPAPPPKGEALRRLDEAIDLVVTTLEQQTTEDWAAPLEVPGIPEVADRFALMLRLTAHFHHHVGQMIYLAKAHAQQAADAVDAVPALRYVHTNLVARDWRSLGAFYERALGCEKLAPERDLSGDWLDRATGIRGARIRGAHYRMGGGGPAGPTLEIFQYEPTQEGLLPSPDRAGFGHIAFQVADVELARQAVLNAGGTAVGSVESVQIEGAGRITWTYVRDPEGNIIELQAKD